jgi:hypothetical protein
MPIFKFICTPAIPVVGERPIVKVSLLSKHIFKSSATSRPSGISGRNASRVVPEYRTPSQNQKHRNSASLLRQFQLKIDMCS